MNPQDAIAYCYEYNLDDADLVYSLSFAFVLGQKVCYEQDPPQAWEEDNFSGVFYTSSQPEFATLLARAQFPECSPLTVSCLGEFPGRGSDAVRVQLKGSLQDILAYGEKIGVEFVVPEGIPKPTSYRLMFDSLNGVNSRYSLELIGASYESHERAQEVSETFDHDLAQKFDPAEVNAYPSHVKVPLTPDCGFNYKAYIRVDRL